jgi:hypothetical protein
MNSFFTGYRILLVCFMTSVFVSVQAQRLTSFSGDSTRFIAELTQLFSVLSKTDQQIVEKELEAFIMKWESGEISQSRRQAIITVSANMLRRRLMPVPDFYYFLRAINTFYTTSLPANTLDDWFPALDRLGAEKSIKPLQDFIKSSVSLFAGNLIYKSSSTEWKIITPDYRIHSDPEVFLDIGRTDLICHANRDSLTIFQTKGKYYPAENQWIGEGGRIDWRRAGLDPSKIYADLSEYRIPVKFSRYEADSVNFYNKTYFSSPMAGKLIDKVQADVAEENASYPQFYSADSIIGISDIFKHVDYLGGFSMEGQKVIGFGRPGRDAEVIFRRNGQEFITTRSRSYEIRPDRINSRNTAVTIHHGEDSVFHSAMVMKYLDPVHELSFNQDERSPVMIPWFDTWHEVEIYSEAAYWNLDKPVITFEALRGGRTASRALFESGSYYSLDMYDRIQGIDEINPLDVIRRYIEKTGSMEFSTNELTTFWRKPREQVEAQLISLNARGFLIYDQDDQIARVKEKLINYVDARNEKTDYDAILIGSEISKGSNAELNLESFDMKIRGIQDILLSDPHTVYIRPANGEIVMKKNRDFVFSGLVRAGCFEFLTKESSFQYDTFRLNLPQIDKLILYTRSPEINPSTGRYDLTRVHTALNDLSGNILIDKPNNKSGVRNYPQYPIFNSTDTALVHWEDSPEYPEVYLRERFNYQVYPFTFTGIDSVVKERLKFDGHLFSGGIFPVITRPLEVREDKSLGLVETASGEGLPVYDGKGTFISRIDLSNKGFRGDGILKYLGSTSVSNDFMFFPDSMKTIAHRFTLQERTGAPEYPAVTGDSVREFWIPGRDSLAVITQREDVSMYNDQSEFHGTLGLTPGGLMGNGTMKIKDGEMDSKGFSFGRRTFDALIANFRVKSYDLKDLTISTRNYRTHFDFDQRLGEFKSNIGISRVEFPFNKYICSMDRFDWHIDNESITLTNEENSRYQIPEDLSLSQLIDIGYTGSEFISVHPLQDSLRFYALRANYNLRSNVIDAEGVRIIKVADAAVYPDSAKIRILKDAEIQRMTNANIITNRDTRLHNFYDASVQIHSRNKYTASGIYDYVDHKGDHQQIQFSRIYVDTAGMTKAEGNIPDSAGFRLCPEFAFAGKAGLKASEKKIHYTGAFRAITGCLEPAPDWVSFSASIDPGSISIPVAWPVSNPKGQKLALGMMFSPFESRIYPAFFNPRETFADSVMVSSSGYITYSDPTTSFLITEPGREEALFASGSLVSLNTTNCQIHGEGRINLGLTAGPFGLDTYGWIDHYLIPDSTSLRLAVVMNFPFNEEVLARMSNMIQSTNLPGIQFRNSPYYSLVCAVLPEKDLEPLKSELDLTGRFRKFPGELVKTIILADVKMSWDTLSRSYISTGSIGIGSIGNMMLGRVMTGKAAFSKKRNGDEFSLYLELSPNDYFFFNYRNNILQFISSDIELNDLIRQAQLSGAERKRIGNIARGYAYTLSTLRKMKEFLRSTEPYELGTE